MLEPKKASILRILEILNYYTDAQHPMTQTEIAERLYTTYGIESERKAVARNISILQEMNAADIVVTTRGCYVRDKKFADYELRLLIDSVLSSRHINSVHSEQLINRLAELGGLHFKKHTHHVYNLNEWQKSTNQQFFLNIDLIDEAIDTGKQVALYYNKFGADKQLHPTRSVKHVINPYQFVLHNQHYYLVCNMQQHDTLTFLRVDKITDTEILRTSLKDYRTLKSCQNGLNLADLCTTLPYMFSDKKEKIVLKCKTALLDELVDWFGTNFKYKRIDDDFFEATLSSSPTAMLYWIMQYNVKVEVLAPLTLRNKVIDTIQQMADIYTKPDQA